jgi:diguanylate cyclase (GGDEF)-like protein
VTSEHFIPLDLDSLLAAIAITACGLMATLGASWLGSRTDRYLLAWAVALGIIAAGVALYGFASAPYLPAAQYAGFALMLGGFALIYFGAALFRRPSAQSFPAVATWIVASTATGLAYTAELAGLGIIIANFFSAAFFALAGWEYWRGRAEGPLAMTMSAALYLLTAFSFALCAIVPLMAGTFTLDGRPSNWAEDVNAIVVIVAFAGMGGLALMMHQMRYTRLHHHQAMTDPLTGLYNRRALFANFAGRPPGENAAVIMFDLDNFKRINDRFGHAVGDEVLCRFAAILREGLRPVDFGVRLGGEEFCVVLDDVEAHDAVDVAERTRLAFRDGAAPDAGFGSPTVSAGIAVSTASGETLEQLLHRADEALYAAKLAGRDRVNGPVPRLVA